MLLRDSGHTPPRARSFAIRLQKPSDPQLQLWELRECAGRRGWKTVHEYVDAANHSPSHGLSACDLGMRDYCYRWAEIFMSSVSSTPILLLAKSVNQTRP